MRAAARERLDTIFDKKGKVSMSCVTSPVHELFRPVNIIGRFLGGSKFDTLDMINVQLATELRMTG